MRIGIRNKEIEVELVARAPGRAGWAEVVDHKDCPAACGLAGGLDARTTVAVRGTATAVSTRAAVVDSRRSGHRIDFVVRAVPGNPDVLLVLWAKPHELQALTWENILAMVVANVC